METLMEAGGQPTLTTFFAETQLRVGEVYGRAVPMIGTSIGRADEVKRRGTLGFYLKADITKSDTATTDTLYFGATCHHVLARGM